jgi:hypothetical protein
VLGVALTVGPARTTHNNGENSTQSYVESVPNGRVKFSIKSNYNPEGHDSVLVNSFDPKIRRWFGFGRPFGIILVKTTGQGFEFKLIYHN